MSKKWKIAILIIGGIFLLGYFSGWWEIFYKGIEFADSVQPTQPSSVMYNSELNGWEDHELAWTIGAAKIWESSDSNYIYFEDIHKGVIYTDNDGKINFTADWARWEKAREEMKISGNLEAVRDDERFITSEALMKYKTEELFCPKEVRYFEKDLEARADTMSMNFEKEEVMLEGNVVLNQKGDIVRSEGLIFWKKDKKFKLIKPIEAIIQP
jgi:LPS export ABC transporter protein LptC